MSARAMCPECGRVLTVRSDERLPKHWKSPRAQLAGEPRCEGSQVGTRHWPTSTTGIRHKRT